MVQSLPGARPRVAVREGAPCTGGGGAFEMAYTGLAVLAFQAGGHYYFNETDYSAAVRKALDWIVDHQKDDGALVGSLPSPAAADTIKNYMYEHGIAAFALGDAVAAAIALHEPPQPRYLQESPQGREVHRAEPAPRRRLALRRRPHPASSASPATRRSPAGRCWR